MSETVIRGTVGDVIARGDVGRYVVPDAVHHHIHNGEEVAMLLPEDRGEHPLDVLEAIPLVGWVLRGVAGLVTPRRWLPPANPVVIAPAGTFDADDIGTHEIVVEPVVDPDVPAADGSVPVYRFVESVPFEERDGIEWPTPSFDHPGEDYFCSWCGEFVDPGAGDQEAALLIAARTTKLCGDCADGLLDEIDDVDKSGGDER